MKFNKNDLLSIVLGAVVSMALVACDKDKDYTDNDLGTETTQIEKTPNTKTEDKQPSKKNSQPAEYKNKQDNNLELQANGKVIDEKIDLKPEDCVQFKKVGETNYTDFCLNKDEEILTKNEEEQILKGIRSNLGKIRNKTLDEKIDFIRDKYLDNPEYAEKVVRYILSNEISIKQITKAQQELEKKYNSPLSRQRRQQFESFKRRVEFEKSRTINEKDPLRKVKRIKVK